jgi:hypothetical protein
MVAGIAFIIAIIFSILAAVAFSNKGKNNTVGVNDKKRIARQKLLDINTLKVEYTSRARILNDSIKLIETTNNIDVLLSRYIDATREYGWMAEQYRKGMPIKLQPEPHNFLPSINKVTNINIVRIANYQFGEFKIEISTLKSKKAIDDRFVKMFELIQKCTSSLKHHQNQFEVKDELNEIHSKIEDLFQNY